MENSHMATSVHTPHSTPPHTGPAGHGTSLLPAKLVRARPLFDPPIVRRALRDSFIKLNPLTLYKNPVIFVVEIGAAMVSVFLIRGLASGTPPLGFNFQISLWLWFTVLFANFSEAMAEARGKAQADSLRKTKTDSVARRILPNEKFEMVPASKLRAGDCVFCEAGYLIPGDGEVIDGVASVDESVI